MPLVGDAVPPGGFLAQPPLVDSWSGASALGDLSSVAGALPVLVLSRLEVAIPLFCVLTILLVLAVLTCLRVSGNTWDLLRFVGFVTLHLANYTTNVMTMCIIFVTHHRNYLFALLPVHGIIGLFCIYTATTQTHWSPRPCSFLFMVVVLGLMQGVQVKLAHDDFMRQRALQSGESTGSGVPTLPARFHCKAMDGILEATIFGFVAMNILLGKDWLSKETLQFLTPWQTSALYVGSFFSFLTTGLALMEVDYRTSTAVQKMLDKSVFLQMCHLMFRASEFSVRLLTILAFCTFTRAAERICRWAAILFIVFDYIVGIVLLRTLGGQDPIRCASPLLGTLLFVVNVFQFVDAPGMSLQARQISAVIVPFRTVELALVLAFICSSTRLDEYEGGVKGRLALWSAISEEKKAWVEAWAVSGVMYYILLALHGCRVKPTADLHVLVADGDSANLEQLLCSSQIPFDINRYGPNGRTPLHLASFNGEADCMRLLIEGRASIHSRTRNRLRNTALHLAVMNSRPVAVRLLCYASNGDPGFLNATNAHGDTALHVAAKRHNLGAVQELLREPLVSIRLTNAKGQTVVDCAHNDKFTFDRNGPEMAIVELLEHVQAGIVPARRGSYEMVELRTQNRSESDRASAEPDLDEDATVPSTGVSVASKRSTLLSRQSTPFDHNIVPLKSIQQAEEQDFLLRHKAQLPTGAGAALLGKNVGISSFMLSAGIGALSHVFLSSISEEPDDASRMEEFVVKANFSDFHVIRPLGEGAFGKVNLVKHRETEELFAMKLMDKAKFKSQKITNKARREEHIMKTARHPFIVQLHYAFQGSAFWALVMEYCPNGDMQALLCNWGTPGLRLEDVARLTGEVLLALEYLHGTKVIFRDMKLENVIIDAAFRSKLTDFGLAKKVYKEEEQWTMCGSYGYAAPEIMLNTGKYTYAVDLYSFGVMLYMLVSGGVVSKKGNERIPPMKHLALRRKIKESERDASELWTAPEIGVLPLLKTLLSEDPQIRGTPATIKEKLFYTRFVGRPLDALLADPGPFGHPRGSSTAYLWAGQGSAADYQR